MYLFVYKTTHVNGKYYIGRHQTDNLNDGYLGSGKWVSGIKDKSTLSREIIAETNSIEELYELEEYYIDLYFDDPLCMNMKKASVGFTSEESSSLQVDKVANGTHPLLKREDGSSVSSDRVKEGTHNLLKREDGSSVSLDKVKDGTHPLLKREDGSSVSSDRVKEGTHNLLKREDGTSVASDRVKEGTHPLLRRPDGSSLASDRVKKGTHNLVGGVSCYDKSGKCVQITKELYNSQSGPMEDWDWVFNCSKEGQRRKLSF